MALQPYESHPIADINSMSSIPEYGAFQHLMAVGMPGSVPGEFDYPEGVSVHEDTGHIYVSDCGNHCIRIFSETGEHLNQFGDEELSMPQGILIHADRLYVTDYYHDAIFQFSITDLTMIKRVGKKGSGNEEFYCPYQLAISPNRYLYVADCWNDRLQILNCDLLFQSSLQHRTLTRPIDLNFSKDQILILSYTDNPCVHMFTLSGEKIRSIITRGDGMQVRGAHFFCLDGNDNIVISDFSAYAIKVFSPGGDLLNTLGVWGCEPGKFCGPKGILILRHTKLVCVSISDIFALQIFSV